jgi:DNA-binding SARP family transcriptional activator
VPNFTQVGTRGLVRRRLLDDLAPLRVGPLALVVAPAGFGKTTLLSHYAHAFDGSVCWLSATAADADPAVFTARVREAAGRAGPAGDLTGVFAAHPGGRQVLLVVDDAHYLEGSESESLLGEMLVAAPPHLHTALGSRRMPGLNLSRHELSGLVVIDAERLRFRSWEAEELLRDVYREPLPPAEVAALARRLGGWVAGLHMFHLSTRGRSLPQRRAAVAAVDGRAALSRAYLARTVLAELPADLHEFLVRTSVFDVVTAHRCDLLLGGRDSQQHLAALERLQAFTTSHDGGRTYRYHEVMRACLAVTMADGWGDEAARDWYTRAAGLLEEEGALAEAARAYARAGRWPAVRRLLDHIGAGIVDDGVEAWSELLPDWLVAEDPWLVLAEGRHLLSRGQLTAAIAHFGHAEALFTAEDGRAHCRAATARASIWLPGPALPGPALTGPGGAPPAASWAWPSGHLSEWTSLLRAATKRHPAMLAEQAAQRAASGDLPALRDPPPGAHRRTLTLPASPAALLCVQVLGHALAGDAARAAHLLREADLHAPGLPGLVLRLLAGAADLARGEAGAANRLADAAAEAERHGWPWLMRMARAAAALDQTEPGAKTARTVADECARDADAWGELIASGLAWLPHAGRAGGGSGPGGADLPAEECGELADLVRRCRRLDAGVLEAWLRGLHAVAAAAAGLPDADAEAARAASLADAAGVPGAAVAALAARAIAAATPAGAATATAVAAAHAAARAAGLPAALVTAWLAGAGDRQAPSPTGAPTAAHPGGAGPGGAGPGGAGPGGAGPGGAGPGGAEPGGAEPGGAEPGGADVRGAHPASAHPAGGPPAAARPSHPAGARLRVQCLAGFAVHLDGDRIDWSAVRPRARALLRLLAVHAGTLVHREVLTDALWPDLNPAAATHNLHVAVSSLRKLLEPGTPRGRGRVLVRDGDAYGLVLPAGGHCDVAALRADLDRARAAGLAGDQVGQLAALRAAVSGYAGDLLPEDGAAEWVVREREDLRHRTAAAAATLAALELATGDTTAALAAAQRSVAVDPYADEGWRLLIEVHDRDGDLGAASRARQGYGRMLAELGVQPAAR